MYLSDVLPWNSSKWIAPPPEEINRIRAEAGTHDDPEVAAQATAVAPPAINVEGKTSQRDSGESHTGAPDLEKVGQDANGNAIVN